MTVAVDEAMGVRVLEDESELPTPPQVATGRPGFRYKVRGGATYEVEPGATPNLPNFLGPGTQGGNNGSVSVSPTGSDNAPGTPSAPVQSLPVAFDRARANGARVIYADPGAYLLTGPAGRPVLLRPPPVTIIGPPMTQTVVVTAAPGSTQGVILSVGVLTAEALEGLTVTPLTGANATPNPFTGLVQQRTCRANNANSFRVGHAFTDPVAPGDTFSVRANGATITWDRPLVFDLEGGFLDTLAMDWGYAGPNAPPARIVQFLEGRAIFTCTRIELGGRSFFDGRGARVGMSGSLLTDARFPNLNFGATGGRMFHGAFGTVLSGDSNSDLVIDGSLARRGRILALGGTSVVFESSDLANSQIFVSRAELLMEGDPTGDEPVRARLEEPLAPPVNDATITNFAGGLVQLESATGWGAPVAGQAMRVSGSVTAGNNGVFRIDSVTNPNKVILANPNGASPDLGPLGAALHNPQVQFGSTDLQGTTGTIILEIGARAEIDGAELEDSVGYGIVEVNGGHAECSTVTGTSNTLAGIGLGISTGVQLTADTTVSGYLGDVQVGTVAGVYAGNLAPGSIVVDPATLAIAERLP